MTDALGPQHETLESFFFAEMEHHLEREGKSLPTEVEAYVVHLLARFVRRTAVAGRHSSPLGLAYLSAKQATGTARAQALRDVGDRALYISGVVPRSLDRTPVNVRYVQSIGESAYREIAHKEGPRTVFGHLAALFEPVSDVIGTIVEPDVDDSSDLLGLYERWRTHGAARDAKRLLRAGVLLDPSGSDTMQ